MHKSESHADETLIFHQREISQYLMLMKDERGVDIRSKENIKEEETVPGTERICTFMYHIFRFVLRMRRRLRNLSMRPSFEIHKSQLINIQRNFIQNKVDST